MIDKEEKNRQLVWECVGLDVEDVADDRSGWRCVRLKAAEDGDYSVRAHVPLGQVADPFWCVPGLFWGDNRQDQTPMLYPRFDPAQNPPKAFVSAFWQFHVSRLTQPMVACHDGHQWWILEVEPYARSSACAEPVATSLGFAFRPGESALLCSLPPVEEPYRPVGCDYTQPRVESLRLRDGDIVEWRYRVFTLQGPRQSLLEVLADAYHAAPAVDKARPPVPTDEVIARAARNGIMRWHYQPDRFCFNYAVAYDRIAQQIAESQGASLDQMQMMMGWVSGWILFEALLDYSVRFNDPQPRDAVIRVWEHLARTIHSPSGFWWSRYMPPEPGDRTKVEDNLFGGGKFNGWDGGWMPDKRHIHLRTLGDAVLRASRTLQHHEELLPFADVLREDLVRQARLVADIARSQPVLPLSVDGVTGEPQPLAGTAGMIWLSVWTRLAAMDCWSDREIIIQCADAYRGSVESGLLYGAPEDIGECTSSEDCYIALNAYVDLYEMFGRDADLQTALQAARWLYLWRRSFKVQLPPRSILGAYQLNSRGGDLASPKNNHLHVYGLDVDHALRKLTQWTGNSRWEELADDHWLWSVGMVCVEDGQFNGYEGMLSEQYYYIDWSCLGNSVFKFENDDRRSAWDTSPYFRNRGNLAGFSTAWCVGFALKCALDRLALAEGK